MVCCAKKHALVLRTRAILRSLKNSLVRVFSKLHSKPCKLPIQIFSVIFLFAIGKNKRQTEEEFTKNEKDAKKALKGIIPFATQALSQTQRNVSEPQTGIEPATF